MGVGIRGRYARCQLWWEPHLQCCRDFIQQSLQPGKTVAILGAGRLLDVDISDVAAKFEHIYLLDADPACLSHWRGVMSKEHAAKVTPCIEEVTDTLDHWTAQLERISQRDTCTDLLRNLEARVPPWASRDFDVVISLNILGQLPLYWRDRVIDARKTLLEAEWNALQVSMGKLQAAHLQGLAALRPARTLVLTDTEYYFYHVDKSEWRVEPALFGGGLQLFEEMRKSSRVLNEGSWLWHLAPQFVESDEEGEIHRVEALALSRPPRASA